MSDLKDEPRWVCLEGMNKDEFAAYEFGCNSCQEAVLRILDGKDTGEGACNEPWQSLRARLLEVVRGGNVRIGDTGGSQPYAVSASIPWRYDPAPRGVKLFLLTKGGIAVTGVWKDNAGFIAWREMFKRDKEMEERLEL